MVGWSLVAENKECDGSEVIKGWAVQSIEACSSLCKGVASMFIFGDGFYDLGCGRNLEDRCEGDGCKCYCEKSATAQGACNIIDHDGYCLYKYTAGD